MSPSLTIRSFSWPVSSRSCKRLHLCEEDDLLELSVTLGGRRYQVKSGRQQVLNLLVSTFENAVEKNRDLHRSNEQLTLAKEKLAQTNVQLESLNVQLSNSNDG